MPQIEKPQNNTKWDRINTIYQLLSLSHEGLTIQNLSQKLGVSSKTIQRDLYEVLGAYGAVKSGRMWKLDKKQSNDNLNPQERIILGILDEMAKNGGNSFYGKAHALLKQVSQQLEHPIFANLDSEHLENAHVELFTLLEEAIKSKMEVMFTYKKRSFQIKPLKLAFFDGFWYLLGLDSQYKNKFKKFHLKSISHYNITKENFSVSSDIEERLKKANSIWFDLDNELFDVYLFIEKGVAKAFERKPLKSQTIVGKDADGSVELVVSISHEMEIIPLIFWYIPHIRVLEPQWLADSIKSKIEYYSKSIQG